MSRLDAHVAAVQRKLAMAIFVEWLSMSAFVLAIVALLAIVVQKLTQIRVPAQMLWIGLGGVVLVALVVAIARRPDRHAAAVAIDQRLALKEKFSTALHVRRLNDPFAQAVVRDAELTADSVHLSGKFPLSFPRAGYWAIGAAVLAGLVFMLPWQLDLLGRQEKRLARQNEERRIAETRERIQEAIARIDAAPRALHNNEQVRIARAQLQDLLKHSAPDPTTASRRTVEALSKVEEAMKQQVEQNQAFALAEKNQAMFRSMSPPLDAKGPVAEAHRQIVKGDYKQAVEDLQKAVNQFDKMSEAEKKQAAQQMQAMAEQLKAMANDPRAMQKMAEQMKQMGANQNQIRQAQQLMQQAANGNQQAQQQLQQLQKQIAQQMNNGQGASKQQAQQLQQLMQQAMQAAQAQAQAGQMAQGAQQMAQAMQQAMQGQQQGGPGQQMAGQQQLADALAQLQGIQQDAEQMQRFQQQLDQALAQAGGNCNNPGDQPGPGGKGQWQAGDPNQQGNGQGGPGIGAGGRGEKTAAPFGHKAERDPSAYDPTGKHLASIYVKDRSIKGESRMQLKQALEAGQADEGDDVDDSRADRRSQEVQRRYFQTMADELQDETK